LEYIKRYWIFICKISRAILQKIGGHSNLLHSIYLHITFSVTIWP
jgi:hypothetical protein